MERSGTRTAWVSVLASVLVVAAGLVAFLQARADAVERAAATVSVDGAPRDCGPHRALAVAVALEGSGEARFAVDGVEVPSRRLVVAGTDRVETSALLPAPVRFPRCGEGVAHRYDVLTATPRGCRWTVASQQTQEEARGHRWALQESGTGCTLVLAPG